MKKYQLEIKTSVLRQIENLPGRYRQRVRRLIAELATDPRPPKAEALRTFPNRYRIRVDDYRIVYRVEDDLLIVEVVKVGRKLGPEFYDDV
ncbi:MAG: type II toxin-antitoxin system RelE/ParE family toxin [Caldilineaceae bacterium]